MLIPFGILSAAGAGGDGGGVPAFDLIESVILASSAASVTFSGLDAYAADYKHLQIRYAAKSTDASRSMFMQLNSATTPYRVHTLSANGSSVTSETTTDTSMEFPVAIKASTVTGFAGAGVFDILDYSNASKNTTVRAFTGAESITLASGALFSTAAITSITLKKGSGSFSNISRFSIYGVKG